MGLAWASPPNPMSSEQHTVRERNIFKLQYTLTNQQKTHLQRFSAGNNETLTVTPVTLSTTITDWDIVSCFSPPETMRPCLCDFTTFKEEGVLSEWWQHWIWLRGVCAHTATHSYILFQIWLTSDNSILSTELYMCIFCVWASVLELITYFYL